MSTGQESVTAKKGGCAKPKMATAISHLKINHCNFPSGRSSSHHTTPQATMASSASIKKTIGKILDPTKIGTWNLVRRPPIEKSTVIQGIPRNPRSNAFKEHQKREGIRLRKALNHLTHGKNIFAYHNLRTNQVIYSLTRYLEVSFYNSFQGSQSEAKVR